MANVDTQSYKDGWFDATKGTLVMDFDRWDDADYVDGYLEGHKGRESKLVVADDNPFSGDNSSNPFSGGGPASSDPQMDTSMADVGQQGGDTINPAGPDTSNNQATGRKLSSLEYNVLCLSCLQEGTLSHVASTTRCRCGSDNLAFERVRKQAEFPPKKKEDAKTDDKSGDDKSSPPADPTAPPAAPAAPGAPAPAPPAGATPPPATPGQAPAPAPTPAQPGAPAQPTDPNAPPPTDPNAAQPPAPAAQAPATGGDEGGPAQTGGDPSALKGEDEPGPVVPMIDPVSGQPVPVQAPPSEGTGALPGEGGDPAAAAGDPAAAGAVDPATGQPAIDPATGQPALGTEPMDIAQQTLDRVVDQVNQLGHDAMESAYDVDSLFSEWRCNNCGQEGRADISEDGQVGFSGDLLEQPQGCTMPGGPDAPGQPPAPAPAPADPNAASAAPAAPEGDSQPPAKKEGRWFRRFRRQAADELGFNSDREHLNDDNAADANPNQEEKLVAITSSILSSNPGMNIVWAREIAEDTLARFPSVAGD